MTSIMVSNVSYSMSRRLPVLLSAQFLLLSLVAPRMHASVYSATSLALSPAFIHGAYDAALAKSMLSSVLPEVGNNIIRIEDIIMVVSSTGRDSAKYLRERIIPSARTWMRLLKRVFVIIEDSVEIRFAMRQCQKSESANFTTFLCANEPAYILTRRCTADYYVAAGICCKFEEAINWLATEHRALLADMKYMIQCDDDNFWRVDQLLRYLSAVEKLNLSQVPLVANNQVSFLPERLLKRAGSPWKYESGCYEVKTNGWYQPMIMNRAAVENLRALAQRFVLTKTCAAFDVSQDVGVGIFLWMTSPYHIDIPGIVINGDKRGSGVFSPGQMVVHAIRPGKADDCNANRWPPLDRYDQYMVTGCGSTEKDGPFHRSNSSALMYDAWRYFNRHGKDVDIFYTWKPATTPVPGTPSADSVVIDKKVKSGNNGSNSSSAGAIGAKSGALIERKKGPVAITEPLVRALLSSHASFHSQVVKALLVFTSSKNDDMLNRTWLNSASHAEIVAAYLGGDAWASDNAPPGASTVRAAQVVYKALNISVEDHPSLRHLVAVYDDAKAMAMLPLLSRLVGYDLTAHSSRGLASSIMPVASTAGGDIIAVVAKKGVGDTITKTSGGDGKLNGLPSYHYHFSPSDCIEPGIKVESGGRRSIGTFSNGNSGGTKKGGGQQHSHRQGQNSGGAGSSSSFNSKSSLTLKANVVYRQ